MKSSSKKIFLSPPDISIEERENISKALDSNWIAPLGPYVEKFEQAIASYHNVPQSLVLSSGTSAIHLGLSVLGITKGDIVFCSTWTFVASANPILYLGATPVFIDSEPDTWNMSPQALRRALEEAYLIKKLPKAVIVVDLYGQCALYNELKTICDEFSVPILEDAAEALGADLDNKKAGTFGKVGIFSFNGNKIITSSGGGALISDDEELIERARYLSTQAKKPAPHFEHDEVGYNYRMSNILAALGLAQFQKLDQKIKYRQKVFDIYSQNIAHLKGVRMMPSPANGNSTRWLSVIALDKMIAKSTPQNIIHALEKENIEARHAWKPMHLQNLFKKYKHYPHDQNICISEKLFQEGICLPSGSDLKFEEQMRVINIIQNELR